MALDLKKLKEKYSQILGSAGKTLTSSIPHIKNLTNKDQNLRYADMLKSSGERLSSISQPQYGKESLPETLLKYSFQKASTVAGGTLSNLGRALELTSEPQKTAQTFRDAPVFSFKSLYDYENPSKASLALDLAMPTLDVTDVSRYGLMGLFAANSAKGNVLDATKNTKLIDKATQASKGVSISDIKKSFEIRPLRAELKGKFGVQRPDLPGIPDNLVFNSRKEAQVYIDAQLPTQASKGVETIYYHGTSKPIEGKDFISLTTNKKAAKEYAKIGGIGAPHGYRPKGASVLEFKVSPEIESKVLDLGYRSPDLEVLTRLEQNPKLNRLDNETIFAVKDMAKRGDFHWSFQRNPIATKNIYKQLEDMGYMGIRYSDDHLGQGGGKTTVFFNKDSLLPTQASKGVGGLAQKQAEFNNLVAKMESEKARLNKIDPNRQITTMGENLLSANDYGRMQDLASEIEALQDKAKGINSMADLKEIVQLKRNLRANGISFNENASKQELLSLSPTQASKGVEPVKFKSISIKPTAKTLNKINDNVKQGFERVAKKDFDEYMSSWRRETLPASAKQQARILGDYLKNSKSVLAKDVDQLKDISTGAKGMRDVYRNFKQVFGDKYNVAKEFVLDPFDKSKGVYVDTLTKWSDELKTNVVEKYGFKKGSRESAAIQQYGEGLVNDIDLVNKFGQKKAGQIVEADKWFRKAYDELLDAVNATRRVVYPNNPDKIIPKRQDYYRHFQELNGLQGLRNIFEGPAGIDPSLVGISDFTTPRSKWLSFAQKRLGNQTEYDAVGGFLDYLPNASYAMNIDPHIGRFRALKDELVEATADPSVPGYKKLNNFIEFLEDYANDLSGKTNPLDRGLQKYLPGGRKLFSTLNWINSRVKANTILGNVSSSVSQIFNVPQGIASAGELNFLAGATDTVMSPLKSKKVIDQSAFIKERYARKILDQFDEKLIQQPKKFAVWMTGALDEFGTKAVWNAHYKKAISENISNPIKYADDITRSLVAGRGIGEVPIAQKAKVFQLVAPFQLEVANLWWVMKDMVDEKSFGKLAKVLAYNWAFNSAVEPIIGRRVTFDPINAIVDSLSDEDVAGNPALMAGRVGGEVLGNLPLGQTAAAFYPEYGGNLGGVQLPTRQQFFGEQDPTRFGATPLFAKGLQDPLYKLLPPFGGAQVKKTIEGLGAVNQGYSESKTGRVRFPISNKALNYVQSALFGQYALPEAQEYFDEKRSVLGEKQSQTFKDLAPDDQKRFYSGILEKRQKANEEDELRELVKQNRSIEATEEKIFYWEGNEVKSMEIPKTPVAPQLTNKSALDQQLLTQFNSDVNAEINKIEKLYELGLIDADEANNKLIEYTTLKESISDLKSYLKKSASGTSGSKKKKVVVPKIPSGKVKKVSPKIIKPSETKIVTPSITKVTKKSVKEFNPSYRRDKIMSAKVRT